VPVLKWETDFKVSDYEPPRGGCGCERTAKHTKICREHLNEQIEAIYERYPMLRNPPESDCGCCTADRIADEYGWDIANVWQWELSGLLFLAGDDDE
jgi:hypothetical protein